MLKRPILLFVLMLPALIILDIVRGDGMQLLDNLIYVVIFVALYELAMKMFSRSKDKKKTSDMG